jgi:cbb3-type cytochrome oxidase subunit 3
MKLSDVVSSMHLPLFAEVPLLLFMGVFIGVVLHLVGRRDQFAAMEALPLRDESSARSNRP